MKTPALLIGLVALHSTTQSAVTFAHHSRAVYSDELTEVSGELIGVNWFNPHPWLDLRVVGEGGRDEVWRIEAYGNVMAMERNGVAKDYFQPGEVVTFAGFMNRRRARDMLVSNMLRADGTEYLLGGRAEPYFADRVVGAQPDREVAAREAEAELARAANENRGMFRVWSQPEWRPDRGVTRRHLPFNATAIAARASWDELDNYILRCEQPGMPRIILNPHPFEFIDEGDTIRMLGEEFDIVRTIHMADGFEPESQPSSRQGVSVGRWEGATLVVETTRIDFQYFDSIGTPQSDAIRIEERYTLSPDQTRVDYRWVITDPAYLTEPAVVEGYWLALDREILRYGCTPG